MANGPDKQDLVKELCMIVQADWRAALPSPKKTIFLKQCITSIVLRIEFDIYILYISLTRYNIVFANK